MKDLQPAGIKMSETKGMKPTNEGIDEGFSGVSDDWPKMEGGSIATPML